MYAGQLLRYDEAGMTSYTNDHDDDMCKSAGKVSLRLSLFRSFSCG